MKVTVTENNSQGEYFEKGKAFGRAKWSEVIDFYQTEVKIAGKCSPRRLSQLARIGRKSADKAISYHHQGFIPSIQKQTVRGVGSLKRMKMKHHAYIYTLYLSNPALPNYGYCEEMGKKFGLKLSPTFITRWFKTIGPFKGTFRKTSKFPPAKYSR